MERERVRSVDLETFVQALAVVTAKIDLLDAEIRELKRDARKSRRTIRALRVRIATLEIQQHQHIS